MPPPHPPFAGVERILDIQGTTCQQPPSITFKCNNEHTGSLSSTTVPGTSVTYDLNHSMLYLIEYSSPNSEDSLDCPLERRFTIQFFQRLNLFIERHTAPPPLNVLRI